MKNSWYNLYKAANALPFDIEDSIERFDGIDLIDTEMTQETADKERKNKSKYLGSGSGGVVADIGNNRVRKYTNTQSEAKLAKSLINNTKYPVVKVFSVEQLQENLWAIDTEKVTPLSRKNFGKEDYDMIEIIMRNFLSYNFTDEDLIRKTLVSCNYHLNGEEFKDAKSKQILKYINKIRPLRLLHEINLSWDCKPENVGIDSKGNWILFDLGQWE